MADASAPDLATPDNNNPWQDSAVQSAAGSGGVAGSDKAYQDVGNGPDASNAHLDTTTRSLNPTYGHGPSASASSIVVPESAVASESASSYFDPANARWSDPQSASDAANAGPSSFVTATPSSFPLARTASAQEPAVCKGVLLVSFDHALGPVIEFSHPPRFKDDPELNKTLPFLALPDGCHAREEDYSYFHLLNASISPDTIFGISCNRQIPADSLLNKDKTVTRSTVQKAIVVLASKPIFGALRDKLGVVTRTFFAQRDFADKSILVELYTSFEARRDTATSSNTDKEGTEMYMGTSLRELVHKFRHKTLQLLKLLMLQRRVMFYSSNSTVESLCTLQYSLVALIPALLNNLQDAASPDLDARAHRITEATSLKTSDKASLIRYLGLPLNIFGKGAFFQPYLPLQQIEFLQARSYLVGTTNSIFQQQRDCRIDVVVRIDSGTLDVLNARLVPLLALTAADRKWMDEVISTVDSTYSAADPTRPQTSFVGSEDFLRAKFEEYVCSALASIKFVDFLKKGDRTSMLLSQEEINAYNMSSWNDLFIRQLRSTPAFALWDRTTDAAIFDLVEPRHPMEGRTNPIEDVGIRLAHGLQDLHLQENLAPTREAIARGLSTGSEHLLGAYSYIRSDLSKRTQEFNERRQSYTSTSSAGGTAADAGPGNVGSAVWAGVDVAKTGAASLATGLSSFLSSRWGTRRTVSESGDRSAPSGQSAPSDTASEAAQRVDDQSSFLRPLVTAPLSTKSSPTTSPLPSPGFSAAAPAKSGSPASESSISNRASGILGSLGSLRKTWIEGSTPSDAPVRPSQERRPSQLKELELLEGTSAQVSRDPEVEQAAREVRAAKRRDRELALAEAKLNGLPPPP